MPMFEFSAVGAKPVLVLASLSCVLDTFLTVAGNNSLKFDTPIGVVSMLAIVPHDGIDVPEYSSVRELVDSAVPGEDVEIEDGVVFAEAELYAGGNDDESSRFSNFYVVLM